MIIDCISDLHGSFPKLQGGDLLIIAGDCTTNDSLPAWSDFFSWLDKQKYRKKIVIGGNHDNFLFTAYPKTQEEADELAELQSFLKDCGEQFETFEYLCDSGCEFEGLKIWGSPWTKQFSGMNPDCMAFTVLVESQLEEKWALIPDDTEILITHCPPFATLDTTWKRNRFGSLSLAARVSELEMLKLHVFGHIHDAYGKYKHTTKNGHTSINASHMNSVYEPVNRPIRIVL